MLTWHQYSQRIYSAKSWSRGSSSRKTFSLGDANVAFVLAADFFTKTCWCCICYRGEFTWWHHSRGSLGLTSPSCRKVTFADAWFSWNLYFSRLFLTSIATLLTWLLYYLTNWMNVLYSFPKQVSWHRLRLISNYKPPPEQPLLDRY